MFLRTPTDRQEVAEDASQSKRTIMNSQLQARATQLQPARINRFFGIRSLRFAPHKDAVRAPSRAGRMHRAAQLRVQAVYGAQWSTPGDAYVTVGLAHCFEKTDEGKLADRFVIEPITANSLECMANGAKTCFKHVFSLTLEDALARNKGLLPPEFEAGVFCENYEARCDACARTWMRPHALDNLLDLVPLGQVKSNWNYSTDDKRVLNFENVVNDDDNIKQDISIDVYGRKEKQEEAASAAEKAAPKEEEEDDLDALLTA